MKKRENITQKNSWLFLGFALEHHKAEKKVKSDVIPHTTQEMDWTKLLTPT